MFAFLSGTIYVPGIFAWRFDRCDTRGRAVIFQEPFVEQFANEPFWCVKGLCFGFRRNLFATRRENKNHIAVTGRVCGAQIITVLWRTIQRCHARTFAVS